MGSAFTVGEALTDAGQVVSSGMTWLGEAASAVTSNGLLMTFVCISLIGTGIGLLRRLVG